MAALIFIAVFVTIGVVVVFNITWIIYRRHHTVRYNAISQQGLEEEYKRQVAKKDERMRVEVEKRKAEEDDTTKGKHIWFSRYVQNGRFKHWVLIIENTKYELRRDMSNGNYRANIDSWTIDQEKREAAIAERKIPDVDGYYVCLIGWTEKEPEELKKICDAVMARFGTYNIVWNNCQGFLRTFADRVVSEKALDWGWFHDNTKTEYQEAQVLEIPTPDEIIAANRSAAQGQMNAQNQQEVQHNLHAMHQHIHAQSQIALQNQIQQQIQIQQQVQIQQQMQIQQIQMQNQMTR